MLTVPEAARRAGRNPETIRRWIWSGRLPAHKVGNQHVIEEAALDALIGPAGRDAAATPPADTSRLAPEWREWLATLEPLHERLRGRGRLPSAGELVRESRRGR